MRIQISDDCYLFSTESGKKSGRLIITSHGVQVPEALSCVGYHANFHVPAGMKLHFYVSDGNSLLNPGIANNINCLLAFSEAEVIGEGNSCKDYLLGKFKPDYYDVIESRIAQNEIYYNEMLHRNRTFFAPCDVLTIRNRWRYPGSWGGIRLSRVLSLLNQYSYQYSDIYCNFCRSPLFGNSPKETAIIKNDMWENRFL